VGGDTYALMGCGDSGTAEEFFIAVDSSVAFSGNSVYWEGQASTAHAVYPQLWEVEVNEQARTLVYDGQIYQLMDYSS
jgi:hypothetical protein